METSSGSQVSSAKAAAASSSVTGSEPGAAGAAESVAAGLSDEVASADSDGLADAESEAAAESLASALSVGSASSAGGRAGSGWPITGRKRSWAVAPSSRACSPSSPGTEMTMLFSPSVTTSASATPRPLTRCSMIWRASSSSSDAGGWPSGVAAVNVTVVPPRRSRPSCGVRSVPVKKISPYRTATMRTKAPKYRRAGSLR